MDWGNHDGGGAKETKRQDKARAVNEEEKRKANEYG
jgi:hypothetical protein